MDTFSMLGALCIDRTLQIHLRYILIRAFAQFVTYFLNQCSLLRVMAHHYCHFKKCFLMPNN